MTTWIISSRLGMTGTVNNLTGQYLSWNITAPTSTTFTFGGPNTIPLVGDWNGDGTEGIGSYDPSNGVFNLRQTATGGNSDISIRYGDFNITPISWYDESGTPKYDGIGVIQGYTVFLDKNMSGGFAEITTTTDNISCLSPLVKQCTYALPLYSHSRSSFSIYETHPYYYSGTFRSLTDNIPSISDLGIDVIYLMPIWHRRDENVLWDVYSIMDYYNIDSVYGTPQELRDLVNMAHSYGIKILFDLVTVFATVGSIVYNNGWTLNIPYNNLLSIASANGWTLNYATVDGLSIVHTGQQQDGNYKFYGAIVGSNVVSFTYPAPWGPAVDRSNPQVIGYFTDIARYHVQEYDIDGWRIDVPGYSYNPTVFPDNHSAANLLTSVINAVKAIKPNAIFISEPTVPASVSVDMEYLYMPFTGIMADVVNHTITSSELVSRLLTSTIRTPLYVIESHDLPRLITTYPLYDKNFMVLLSTFYGSPFIQAGQEIGATSTWMTGAQVNWSNGDYILREFYKKVLAIRNSSNAIKYGFVQDIWKSGNNVYAYSTTYGEDKVVVLLNFGGAQTTCTSNTPFINGDIVTDQLSGETFNVTDHANFVANVPAYSSRILTTQSPPVLTTITVSPNPVSIASGGSQTFAATPKDQYGNPISATITWTRSNSVAGSINSSTGVFAALSVNVNTTTTITATSGLISGNATATVLRLSPVLTTITVTPNPVGIASGGSQTFTAAPKDQYGNPISATITWTRGNSAAGSINSSTGVFTALSVSINTTTTITATSGSVSGAAIAVVLRVQPALTTVTVSPNPVSIASSGSQTFVAAPRDQYGSTISATITWTRSNPAAGSINSSSGVFTASSVSTNTITTITATSGLISGNATATVTATPPILTTITVSPASANIASGGSQLFTAAPKDQYGSPISATITWSINNPVTGSINSSTGLFSASYVSSDAITLVTATSGSIYGTTTAVVLRVSPVLTTITVFPASVDIASGGSQQFTATPKDQYGSPIPATITWTISSPATGSINSSTGLFSASSVSTNTTTVITATSGLISGNAILVVLRVPPMLTTITVSPNPVSIASGGSQTFIAAPKDQYGSPISTTITWTRSNSAAGSINSSTGVFTALSVSTNTTTTITATSGLISGNATATVTIASPVLTTITVSPNPVSIASGGSQTFTATPKDQYNNPISATITWTRSNSAAGSINSSSGVFTASSVSTNTTTTITATSGLISGNATATVLAASPALTTITINPTTATIQIGATQQLDVACTDQYDVSFTCPTLIWSSASSSVATVDSHGLVTGITEGSTSITASNGEITSDASLIMVEAPPAEAGMGGIGMIFIAGIGITALMSAKKPVTT